METITLVEEGALFDTFDISSTLTTESEAFAAIRLEPFTMHR